MSVRRDVRVRHLLEGQVDIESDGLGPGLVRTEVGGFHDAGPPAGSDYESMAFATQAFTPIAEQIGETAGVFVVAGHLDVGVCECGCVPVAASGGAGCAEPGFSKS